MVVHSARNYYATAELAGAYDDDCAGRRDLGFFLGLARRLNPGTIVDLGSGTGLLASMLAGVGFEVIAVEPQAAMLEIAARQTHAPDVTWIHGSAEDLSRRCADLVLMTGHVAQYFLDDAAWRYLLTSVRHALRSGGHLGFEIRNQSVEAWRGWATSEPRPTSRGTIEQSVRQSGDLMTHVDEYLLDGTRWVTSETLRFPDWRSVADGLRIAGYELENTWGDWDGSPVTDRSPEWIILASGQD